MTDDGSKVALSAFEQELVANCSWLYAKQAILEKTALVLGGVANSIRPEYDALRAASTAPTPWLSPKLSRGEAFESLPWLMLDFPREFGGTDWLAIRHFFRWGQGFTLSLLLRGRFMKATLSQINALLPRWQVNDWAMVVTGDPWQHGWKPASQRMLKDLTGNDVVVIAANLGFLQIRKRLPVEEWAAATHFMQDFHLELRPLIRVLLDASYPADGINPLLDIPKADFGL